MSLMMGDFTVYHLLHQYKTSIYYLPQVAIDLYSGTYEAGYIYFVYNGAHVLWIISVNKSSGFSLISQKLCNLQICIIYH